MLKSKVQLQNSLMLHRENDSNYLLFKSRKFTNLSKKGCKSSHQLISGGTCNKLCAVAHKDAESHLNRS